MLNELHDLWQACVRAKIPLPIRIPGLDEGQNTEGLRVFLASDKTIKHIESVSAEVMRRIRKWKCGEGITLPVFNFEPLHALSEAEQKDFKKRMAKALKGENADLRFLKETRALRWETGSQSRYKKLEGAFKNVSADLVQKIGNDKAPAGEAWRALLAILRELAVEHFLVQLSEEVRQRLLREKPRGCKRGQENPLLPRTGLEQWMRRLSSDCGTEDRRNSRRARRWPCILSLLLTRLGYELNTHTTMKETPFLIGRFLAQLDRLHAYYAKYVSGKDEGLRQLLGNSLMSVALETPLRAFELVGQRMLPYQPWAEQFSRGKDSFKEEQKRKDAGFVAAILWDPGRIAEDISERGIPETARECLRQRQGHEAKPPAKPILDLADTLKARDRAWMYSSPAAKAQMLLGYLARPPKKETPAAAGSPAGEAAELPDFDDEADEVQPTA